MVHAGRVLGVGGGSSREERGAQNERTGASAVAERIHDVTCWEWRVIDRAFYGSDQCFVSAVLLARRRGRYGSLGMPPVERSQRADDGRGSTEPIPGQADQWARVKALFLETLCYAESDRGAYLDRATSGNSALRREVESLLENERAAGSFGEVPAAGLLGLPEEAASEASRLASGTRIGSYEITEFVAAGGMGAVYRARHTVLGREVAIKTIGVHSVDDAARRRLIREARHASSLAHENICAIYDVGEADDRPFIVMEYVNGRSLGAITHDGPLPLEAALGFAIQIAAALDHAHQHGIIHRDLKSSNVVVDTAGRAIVLDFGLATRVAGAAAPPSTDSTAANCEAFAGTLSHMAPEILRGETAGVRSDIWAFGVLLFQLVTGLLPFSGHTPFETSAAILTDPPRAMSNRVPLPVRLIIERCLTKDPAARYGTAREVGHALEDVRRRRAWPVVGRLLVTSGVSYVGGAALLLALALFVLAHGDRRIESGIRATRIATLALLPLADVTGDSGATYYAAGIGDALVAQLGAAADVRVLSPAAAAHAMSGGRSIGDVAKALGADAIAQGSLRRVDENVSIALRLVAADGRLLWADSLTRNTREVLALEADLVRELSGAIRAEPRPGAIDRLTTVRAVAPEVYESYLKGRYEWNRRTPASLERAIDHFEHAIQLDPTYAAAHAGLADCYNQLGTVMVGTGSPRRYRPLAEAEAIKALQIDPTSAEAHAALGFVRHYQLRWDEAEHEFRRAITLNPSFALARIWYANLLAGRSRAGEAIEQVNAGRELDPFSLVINTNVGWVLEEARRYDDAIAQLQNTLALDSTYVQAHARLAGALLDAGRLREARLEAMRVIALTDSAPSSFVGLALIDVRDGQRDSARAILQRLQAWSRDHYVPPVSIAHLQAALGDIDGAMKSMELAFAEGSNAMAYLDVAREFDPLRSDSRFQALRKRAGLL